MEKMVLVLFLYFFQLPFFLKNEFVTRLINSFGNLFQRIDVLVKENRYQDALALALSMYEGKAKAVVGLSGPSLKKKEIVSDLVS